MKKFGLDLVDAERELTIPLLQADIDKADEVKVEDINDEANFLTCVLAQGVTRVCGARRVAILRTVAYVAYPGDKVTRRYEISDKSRYVLERFDRGEPIKEAVELTFRVPSKKRKLAKMRADWHKRKLRPKTGRKQLPSDPLHQVVRNGNLVKWS